MNTIQRILFLLALSLAEPTIVRVNNSDSEDVPIPVSKPQFPESDPSNTTSNSTESIMATNIRITNSTFNGSLELKETQVLPPLVLVPRTAKLDASKTTLSSAELSTTMSTRRTSNLTYSNNSEYNAHILSAMPLNMVGQLKSKDGSTISNTIPTNQIFDSTHTYSKSEDTGKSSSPSKGINLSNTVTSVSVLPEDNSSKLKEKLSSVSGMPGVSSPVTANTTSSVPTRTSMISTRMVDFPKSTSSMIVKGTTSKSVPKVPPKTVNPATKSAKTSTTTLKNSKTSTPSVKITGIGQGLKNMNIYDGHSNEYYINSTEKRLKYAKTWRNGDVLCDPRYINIDKQCGAEGTCFTNEHSNYQRHVCVCQDTYLPMTSELKCPGKHALYNNPWNPVECTNNQFICGNRSVCLRTYWFLKGSEEENKAFCFCQRTMEPMREDFTCPPLSRFNEKKLFPPTWCTGTYNEDVCGAEASCLPYPTNQSSKNACLCPDAMEPVDPHSLMCPRIIIEKFDNEKPFPLASSSEDKMSINNFSSPASTISTMRTKIPKRTYTTSIPTTNSWFHQLGNIVWPIPTVIGTVFLFIFAGVGGILLYLRRSSIKTQDTIENEMAVVPLRNTVLQPEKFRMNPHYSTMDAIEEAAESALLLLSVPVIHRMDMKVSQELGEGQFGKVFRGILHKIGDDPKTVAIKVLKQMVNQKTEEEFIREMEIMSNFEHPNILSVIGYCPRDKCNGPWLVLEYMPSGDLAQFLREIKFPLTLDELLAMAVQIARGMEYLAQQRFVHRDLACRNCLVGLDRIIKIADFGMSRDVYTCDYYKIGQGKGCHALPVRWMPPEGIVYGHFTLETDIWSYGVVLWEVFSYCRQPYYGRTNEEVVELICAGKLLEIPKNCPPGVAAIMIACWNTVANQRIPFPEIVVRLTQMIEDRQRSAEKCSPRSNLPISSSDYDTDEEYNLQELTMNRESPELDDDSYLKVKALNSNHGYENGHMI